MAYLTLIDKMGGEEVFRQEPMDESALREYNIWVENIFVALNKTSEDLIILAAAWLGGARLIDNVRVMLSKPLAA